MAHVEPRTDVPLRALPVERVADDGGLTLRRGCTMVRIDGEHAGGLVGIVLELTSGADRTEDELVALFPPEAQEPIRSLVRELRARRLLLPVDAVEDAADESPLDVFYWHFGRPEEPSPSPPRDELVAVAGRSTTAVRLGGLLREAGFDEIAEVDAPDALGDLAPAVLAAVSENGFGPLRAWNEVALERGLPFLPVAIENLVAYVGPLVLPHETACLECLLRRRYSNLDEAAAREPVELRPDGAEIVGLHPAIAAVAAGAASLELSRFFLPWSGAEQAGYVITFNLLSGRSGRRRVLKVPRCPACSSLRARQPTATIRASLTGDGV